MRVGTFAYCTEQGLGFLARDFIRNGIVDDLLKVRHSRRHNHSEWYAAADWFSPSAAKEFVKTVDLMLFFETPFDWSIIPYCREHGVTTVLMLMHECTPRTLPYVPDFFLCPSLLEKRLYPDRSAFLPVPVPNHFQWKLRGTVRTFVHNAGHGGLKNRNGTRDLLEAIPYVNSLQARFLIRHQGELRLTTRDRRVEIVNESVSEEELYAEGEAFVFPEKFNGLSLPLQEAFASGMLCIATDRYPINTWLPSAPLIQPVRYQDSRIGPAYNQYSEAVLSPRAIAEKINEWMHVDVSNFSRLGRDWANKNSWAVLGPKYQEVLEHAHSVRS